MNDYEQMINAMSNKVSKNFENNQNDYEKDGLLYCGKCNTPKQFILPSGIKVFALCDCMQKEYEEKEKQMQKQEFIRNNKYNIDTQYRNVYMKDIFDIDTDEELKFIKLFIDNFDVFKKEKMGLYIFGEYGNGKTTIASCIANELLERQYKVLMTACNEAIRLFNDKNNTEYYKQKLRTMDLIILDDFGSNRDTDFQKEQLYNLINYLYSMKKVIIITTNIPRKDLGERTDGQQSRCYDRIIEMTKGIHLKRGSMRIKISKEKQNKIDEILNLKGEK